MIQAAHGETCGRVEVLLPLGVALERRAERLERFDLRFGEHVRRRHWSLPSRSCTNWMSTQAALVAAAASFSRPSPDAIWLSSSCSPWDFITRNSCSMTQRAWYQPTICQAAAASAISMRGQQPPMQRLHPRRRIDLAHLDQTQAALSWPACGPARRAGGRPPPRHTAVPPRLCAWHDQADAPAVRSAASGHGEMPPRRRTACRLQPTSGPPWPGSTGGSSGSAAPRPIWGRCPPRGRPPPLPLRPAAAPPSPAPPSPASAPTPVPPTGAADGASVTTPGRVHTSPPTRPRQAPSVASTATIACTSTP